MKKRNQGLTSVVFIVILSVLVVVLTYLNNNYNERKLSLRTNITEINEIIVKVIDNGIQFDEDVKNEGKYQILKKYQSDLDSSLQKLYTMVSEDKISNYFKNKLNLEEKRRAYHQLALKGQEKEADDLLSSSEYGSLKADYSNSLNIILEELNRVGTNKIEEINEIEDYISNLRLLITLGLAIFSIFVLQKLRKSFGEQLRLLKEVEDSNATLEMKVEDRTKDAEDKAIELQKRMSELELISRELEEEAEERKALQELSEKNKLDAEERAYFEEGLTKLSYGLTGITSIEIASKTALEILKEYINPPLAAIYLKIDERLLRVANFAYPENSIKSFQLESTYVGEAAKYGKIIISKDIPKENIVKYGFLEIIPNEIFEVPLKYNNDVIAVLEFGIIETLGGKESSWIDKAASIIGTALYFILEGEKLKNARVEAENAKDRVNTIINSTAEGIFGIDNDGIITFCNRASLKLLGYSDESKLVGKHYSIIGHKNFVDEDRKKVSDTSVEKRDTIVEELFRREDNSMFWAEVMSNQIIKNGEAEGAVINFRDITEKKHIEEERANERAILKGIVNSISGSIFYKDLDGNYLGCNEEFASVFGKTPNDIIGKNERELFSKEESDKFLESDKKILLSQESYRFEEWVEFSNGKKAIIETEKSVLKLSDGKIIGVLGIGRDMTERYEMEEKLQKEKERLTNILETAPVGVGISVGSIMKFVNPKISEIIGAKLGEGIETRYADLQQRKQIISDLENSIAVRNREIQYIDVNGNVKDTLTTCMPIEVEGEEGILVWITDITDRKKMEVEVNEAKENLEIALESAKMGTWKYVVAEDKTYIDENVMKLYGVTNSEQKGTAEEWYDIIHPDDGKEMKRIRKEVMINKEIDYETIFRIFPKDGQMKYLRSVGKFKYSDEGKAISSTGVVLDITDMVEASNKLKKAKELAEEATKIKSDFLANMSHEIRTPMNAIIGLNTLLQNTHLDSKQSDYVLKIGNSAKNLLEIINDILDFSKLEAGKMTLEEISFEFDEVLENVMTVIYNKAVDKGIKFLINKDQKVPKFVVGDPLRLSQILINLANNAVKFTEKGEVSVNIKVENLDTNNVKIQFKVDDTGIGMTEEQVAKLFKAFSQADGSTTRKYGGTGLGLAISKNFVDMMGATIIVHSNFGQGSSFEFTITMPIGKESSEITHRKIDIAPIKGKKILVVEDNEINQQVVFENLKNAGLFVEIAKNGKEAIEKTNLETFDAILMDLQMPIMDGYEATKDLRKKGINIPIIGLSADAMSGTRDKAIKAGMNDYTIKPINFEILYEILLKVLKSKEEIIDLQNFEKVDYQYMKEKLSKIKLDEALLRVGGDISVYLGILSKFYNNYNEFDKKNEDKIMKNEYDIVGQNLHTLKGVAGNIGAETLCLLTEQLENSIRTSEVYVNDTTWSSFKDEFHKLMDEIKDILPIKEEKKLELLDNDSYLKKVKELKEYIENYDTKAEKVLDSLLGNFKALQQEDFYNQLKGKLKAYDFDRALELYETFLKTCNVEE